MRRYPKPQKNKKNNEKSYYAKRKSYHIVSLWHFSLLSNFCTALSNCEALFRSFCNSLAFVFFQLVLSWSKAVRSHWVKHWGPLGWHIFIEIRHKSCRHQTKLNPNYALYINPPCVDLHMCTGHFQRNTPKMSESQSILETNDCLHLLMPHDSKTIGANWSAKSTCHAWICHMTTTAFLFTSICSQLLSLIEDQPITRTQPRTNRASNPIFFESNHEERLWPKESNCQHDSLSRACHDAFELQEFLVESQVFKAASLVPFSANCPMLWVAPYSGRPHTVTDPQGHCIKANHSIVFAHER